MTALAPPTIPPSAAPSAAELPATAALEVRDLTVTYPTLAGTVVALQGASFSLRRGQTLALMGESGCGKSTLGRALLGLLASPGRIERGTITLGGRRVERLSQREWQPLRGREISMLMQDPLLALNPVLPIGLQLSETVRDAQGRVPPKREVRERGMALLRSVGFDDPERVWRSYAFQLSGGMQQRAALAISLVNRPRVLVADEPTTALDVRVQAQVLEVIRTLQAELDLAVVLITHDVGVAASLATDVAVLYGGRMVELGPAARVLGDPAHPYTAGLLGCLPSPDSGLPHPLAGQPPSLIEPPARCPFIPRCARADATCLTSAHPSLTEVRPGQIAACYHPIPTGTPVRVGAKAAHSVTIDQSLAAHGLASAPGPLLAVGELRKRYQVGGMLRRVRVDAVRGASLEIKRGEVLGLVGASGCGKSTLARCVVRLEPADGGWVTLDTKRLDLLKGEDLRRERRHVQIIFQDARGSLNPHRSAIRIVREPLDYFGIGKPAERDDRARSLLERVGLTPDTFERRPGALSSGQCQRVAIARALAPSPDLLVCDEPVSALDLSVQAQILQLLHTLRRELGFGMLFISHNLAVVEALSDRVAVMHAGEIIELLALEFGRGIAAEAKHPVTHELLAAVPRLPWTVPATL